MSLTSQRITELIISHLNGTLSQADSEALQAWMAQSPLNREMAEAFLQEGRLRENILDVFSKEQIWKRLLEEAGKDAAPLPATPVRRLPLWRKSWVRYAAAVILLLGAGAYFRNTYKTNPPGIAKASQQPQPEVLPGGDKAVLTLSDGTTIVLDSAANGSLARQGGAEVVKLANGQIAYHPDGLAAGEIMWNTMRTPAGGQYRVTLPDGTKVWLNAASSITYPTAFTRGTREIRIRGEAYFEVAANTRVPFVVDVDGKSKVEVLGTSFNINSYDNEPGISTTLVEGSIRVSKANQSEVLAPGQQAVIAAAGGPQPDSRLISIKANANIAQALAWKNGFFDFEGLDLRAVMRQLERWYDIRVQYRGAVDNAVYGGKIYRNARLTDVLDILQKLGGVKFKVEGNTLLVL